MKKEVRDRLVKLVKDFKKDKMDDEGVKVPIKDAVLVGSSTNYNWNKFSDLDIHLMVDKDDFDMTEEEAKAMLDGMKSAWNKSHDIKVKGHDVEMNFGWEGEENNITSIFSLLKNKWLMEPKKESPKFEKETIKNKYKDFRKKIEDALKGSDEDKLRKVLEKLYIFRQAGLDKSGEFSAENIVFKILRAQGFVDRLKTHANTIYDKDMTLNEIAMVNNTDQTRENYYDLVHGLSDDIFEFVIYHGVGTPENKSKLESILNERLAHIAQLFEIKPKNVKVLKSDILETVKQDIKKYEAMVNDVGKNVYYFASKHNMNNRQNSDSLSEYINKSAKRISEFVDVDEKKVKEDIIEAGEAHKKHQQDTDNTEDIMEESENKSEEDALKSQMEILLHFMHKDGKIEKIVDKINKDLDSKIDKIKDQDHSKLDNN